MMPNLERIGQATCCFVFGSSPGFFLLSPSKSASPFILIWSPKWVVESVFQICLRKVEFSIYDLVLFCETWNNVTCSIPALGLAIAPQQWESFHFDRSFCLVCSEVHGQNCSMLHLLRLLRVGWKILTDSNIFAERDELSLSWGGPLVAKEQQSTLTWACY